MKKINITFLILMIVSLFSFDCYLNVLQHNIQTAEAAIEDTFMMVSPKTQTIKPGEEFEVKVLIDNSSSNQNIITAGFDMSFPKDYVEVIDADTDSSGIQIDIDGNDFQFNEPELNTTSQTTGIINFTAGNQGNNPVNKDTILVATIQFKAKENVTTRIIDLSLLNNDNTGAYVVDAQGVPQNTIDTDTALENATVVISNVNFELSPSTQNVNENSEITVDVVLNNPDQVDVITLEFELNFDGDRLKPVNTDNKMQVLINPTKKFQVVENDINSTGTIKFTGGFTNSNNDTSLEIASVKFKATKVGNAIVEFSDLVSSSSVYTVDNAINNFLADFNSATYKIGDVTDNQEPESVASPKGGTYFSTQTVRLTADDNTDKNPKIYYTTDGTTPNRYSNLYRDVISISQTTVLKFYAEDESGNKESVNTENYNIGGSTYAIGLTGVKNQVAPGETIGIIVKLIERTVNRSVQGKSITITSSKGAQIIIDPTSVTDEEGELIAEYTAPMTSGIDIVEAKMVDNPTVTTNMSIEILGENISKITLVAGNLKTTDSNFISATLLDSNNQKINNNVSVQLNLKKLPNGETKNYTANSVNGIATFVVPGNDIELNQEYELSANYKEIYSNIIKLNTFADQNTPGNSENEYNGSGEYYRPGGGGVQPATGPKETLLALFLISITGVFYLTSRKQLS